MNDKELFEKAIEAREYAYAPYSKFKVGAALLTNSGKIYTGCNVENASYGGTICAERVAMVKAISEGEREFSKIAVVADTKSPVRPCGICLQFLSEFNVDMDVIMGTMNKELEKKRIRELLPFNFDKKAL